MEENLSSSDFDLSESPLECDEEKSTGKESEDDKEEEQSKNKEIEEGLYVIVKFRVIIQCCSLVNPIIYYLIVTLYVIIYTFFIEVIL